MKSRIKIKLPSLATREEAEAMMTSLAASVNAKRSVTAERDSRVLRINKEYESGLATLDLAISAKTDALRVWAESHPEEFAKGRKSIDMVSGLLGFRTGTPKLNLLSRQDESFFIEPKLTELETRQVTQAA